MSESWLVHLLSAICFILTAHNGLGHGFMVPKLYFSSRNFSSEYEQTSTSLLCIFNSSTPLNVTWMKDGNTLSYGSRIKTKMFMYLSRYYNRLYINSLRPDDAGNYKCIGRNKYGNGDSASFKLEIRLQYKPVIYEIYPPNKLVLYKGQEYELPCLADGYPTVEKYTWTKKSGFIDNHRVQIKNNALFFTYAIKEQAGEYVCKAENIKGSSLKSVQISVVSNPAWQERIKNLTLKAGDPLLLSGLFYGAETDLTITWYLNNAMLVKKRNPDKRKSDTLMTTSYSINSAQVQHSGRYVLEIQNAYGRITSTAEVLVYSKPEVVITEGFQLTATEGDSIQITCTAQGYPPPSITWSSDGRLLAKTSLDSTSGGRRIKSSLTHLIYTVKGVKTYLCTGENNRGRDQGIITVITKEHGSTVGGKGSQHTNKRTEDPSKVPIIIGVISAIIIIIVILILVYVIFFRRKNEELPRQNQGSVVYGKSNNYEDTSNDNAELISERFDDLSIPSHQIIPKPSKRSKSLDRHSTKRPTYKALSDKLESKVNYLERQYAVILPLGQGRLLAYEDLNLGEICGKGQFGVVVKGTLNDEHDAEKPVAVKMLKDEAGYAERKMMLDELNIMKSLSHHPNVVSLVGWIITSDNVYIVEELVSGGSLLHFLRSQRASLKNHYVNISSAPLTGNDAFTFAWQVAAGMKYLSSQNIVHRDLAARNILMAHENICKISDFGLARQIYENTNYKKTNAGELPVRWMATESLFKGIYTSNSDIWSFGILLWELVNLGDIPYPNIDTLDKLVGYLKDEKRMEKPPHCSDALYKLMLSCWQEDPANRPNFINLKHQLGKMLFDKDTHIDFNGLENYLEKIQEKDEDEEDFSENASDKSLMSGEARI